MQNRKRGRPLKKADDSDEQLSQSFSHKPSKKKVPKKSSQPKKKDELANRKSKSKVELSSVGSLSDSEQNSKKYFKVPVQIFNSMQVFADILNKANRDPQFLIMLKNLLSGCARLRQQKKTQYKKKWKMLRNSNCTQNQYISRQNELKRLQTQQIAQIQEDIVAKLALANIRGFQTRDSIVSTFKLNQQQINEEYEYIIDENQWNKYREQQKKLLQILMKENDFVSQDYKIINVNTKYVPESLPNSISNKEEQNQMQLKFNNLETEQNQENIQFLFCKNFNNINYDKVFEGSNPFKVGQDDKYMIDSKAMSWLLESKCDEIYTNDQFQKQTYSNYSKMLADMYEHPQKYSETDIMNNVLESGAYILNSVHYYQKFKLKCQLLHPLDLLLVTQKIMKLRSRNISTKHVEMQPQILVDHFSNQNISHSSMADQKFEKKV